MINFLSKQDKMMSSDYEARNGVASFSFGMTRTKDTFFAFMMRISYGHLFEYTISQRNDKFGEKNTIAIHNNILFYMIYHQS